MNDVDPSCFVSRPRLLIIELDYHAEVLATLCPILAERFDLVLWTTDKIWKKVGLNEHLFAAVLLMPKKQPVARFWRANEAVLRAVDVVYFNTLEKRFGFFAKLDFHCPTVMRIHNTNASLFPVRSIDWSPANFWNVISYFMRSVVLRRTWYHRERLYRKMSLLMLPSEGVASSMRAVLRERGFHNLSDYVLPFSSLGDVAPAVPGQAVVFAITGSVDARRKDYHVLYQALVQLKKIRPQWRLEMIFLGWAKGECAERVLDQFSGLTDDQFSLTCFRDYVSQQTFAEQMARTQFLLAPMKLGAHHKIHREYYGRTKISGIENDLLRYRKPVILPCNYTLPSDLRRVALSYTDAQTLCSAIINMIDADYWNTLTARFAELHDYKSDRIAENFHEVCQNLLQHAGLSAKPELGYRDSV